MVRKILTAAGIANGIGQVRPERVAVAYVGEDWEDFVPDLGKVKDLVVAPVLGTNPKAVRAIEARMRSLHGNGWERLHFLDNLHAKLYLGPDSAVYGSANLSRNGLSGDGLIELCRSTDDGDELSDLGAFFEDVLARAKAAYPTEAQKKMRLDQLTMQTLKNPHVGGKGNGSGPTKLADFQLLADDEFYVSWYEVGALTYTYDGEAKGFQSIIDEQETLCLLPTDQVQRGKWVLCWECEGREPTGVLQWMCIDEIVRGGVIAIDDEPTKYTTLVFQRADWPKRKKQVPFALDAAATRAFVGAFENKRIARALQAEKLVASAKILPELVTEMQNRLA